MTIKSGHLKYIRRIVAHIKKLERTIAWWQNACKQLRETIDKLTEERNSYKDWIVRYLNITCPPGTCQHCDKALATLKQITEGIKEAPAK